MCESQNSFASVDEVIVQRKGARVHSTSPRHENILPSLFLIGKLPFRFLVHREYMVGYIDSRNTV